MGFADSRLYNGRVYTLVLLAFMAVALALLIIGASLHNLYSFDASQIPANDEVNGNVTLTGHAHFGAFYSCIDIDGIVPNFNATGQTSSFAIHQCIAMPTNCNPSFTVQVQGMEEGVNGELGGLNCTEYNAFRSFLVIGIVFLGVALLATLLSLLRFPESRGWAWSAAGLQLWAAVCIVIAYALVADHMHDWTDGFITLTTGPAFGCCVAAWVLMVLALGMFGTVKWCEKEGRGYVKEEGEGKSLA